MFAYNPMRLNIGSIGFCHYEMEPGAVSPDYVVFMCDESALLPRFMDYYTRSPAWLNSLALAGSGSVRERIYFKNLADYEFLLPSLEYQKAAIEILSAFDDKIALNRRMNETLEAMAQAIFYDWFVDFGPVRRKLEGATDPVAIMGGLTPDPARAAELAALFPQGLDEHGLPKGWTERALDEITFPIRRGIAPKYVDEGGALVINQKCIRDGRVSVGPARRHNHALRSVEGRELEVGDVLVNSTGVGTLGRLAQIWDIEEPTVADSHVTVVRADPTRISPLFLGVAMRPREPEIVALGEGSTGQTELSRGLLGRMGFIVPTREVITAFDELCGPIIERDRANMREQRTLAETRDYLLPRLMSGQVHVGNANREMEAVSASSWPHRQSA